MAGKNHVKVKGKWKTLHLDPSLMSNTDLDGFFGFQELRDYEIVKDGKIQAKSKPEKKSKLKAKKNESMKDDKEKNQASEENTLSTKNKKRKKGKKKQQNSLESSAIDIIDDSEDAKEENPKPSNPQKRKANDKPKASPKKKRKKDKKKAQDKTPEIDKSIPISDLTAWKNMFVPEPVLKALAEQGFANPTPIQSLILPSAIRDRLDVVGAAETGSGKTLAFGIPLIHHILKLREKDMKKGSENESDEEMSENSKADENESEANEKKSDEEISDDDEGESSSEDKEEFDLPPDDEDFEDEENENLGCVKVTNNVEFDWLEQPKSVAVNKKVFNKKLYSLILTPTRELAIQVKNHLAAAAKYTDIQIAVIVGGMAAQKQERMLKKCPEIVVATPGRLWELIQQGNPHLAGVTDIRFLVIDEADRMVEKGHFQELTSLLEMINSEEDKLEKRQNYVFSATLTLIHSGPQRVILNKKKKKRTKMDQKQKIESLMMQIGIKEKAKVVDLSRKQGTAETLTEARISCTREEKDFYLYYFLLQYPARSLIFANSKDCIRRLTSLCTLLDCNPLPLHADMHQKQRLKNLDKFKDDPKGLLLATDVAARGLDIPNVEHVIHYQVPRTTENYVHRSGRTARACKEGLSIMLVGPDDMKDYRKIIKTLNRDEDLPVFPTEAEYFSGVRARVALARQIDKEEHQVNKLKNENNWFLKAAEDADLVLDEDELLNDLGDDYSQHIIKQKLHQLRYELKSMLNQSLISATYSGKYPTKSGTLRMPYMKEKTGGGAVNAVKKVDKKAKNMFKSSAITSKDKKKKKGKRK